MFLQSKIQNLKFKIASQWRDRAGFSPGFPFCPLLEKAAPQTFLAEKEPFSRILLKTCERQSITLSIKMSKRFNLCLNSEFLKNGFVILAVKNLFHRANRVAVNFNRVVYIECVTAAHRRHNRRVMLIRKFQNNFIAP